MPKKSDTYYVLLTDPDSKPDFAINLEVVDVRFNSEDDLIISLRPWNRVKEQRSLEVNNGTTH